MTDSEVILPYRFEPDSLWSSSEESDSVDTDSQTSFTERLGNTSCCSCTKCLPMPCAVECICYCKLSEGVKCLEDSDGCVTCLETFKTVSLDKDVLYTALVTMRTIRGDKVETLISNRLRIVIVSV